MNKFSLNKLSQLSSSLSAKEQAKIVIGYLVKQDSGEGNYENEIKTIAHSIPVSQSSEYNFYWHMYMNVQQILLDYQTTYLRLQVQIGRLVFLRYMMHLSLLLVHTGRFHRLSKEQNLENHEEDIYERMSTIVRIIEIIPEKDIDMIRFSSDEIKEIFMEILFVIQRLIQTLANYKKLFYIIEEKIFDGMEIIARKGLWEDVDKYSKDIVTEHNTEMTEFIERSEVLAHPSKVSFKKMPNLMLEIPEVTNEKWIKELFQQLVGYAERDSYFTWR